MLDIKFVRENPEIVKQNIKNKFQDKKLPLVDEVIELAPLPRLFSFRIFLNTSFFLSCIYQLKRL